MELNLISGFSLFTDKKAWFTTSLPGFRIPAIKMAGWMVKVTNKKRGFIVPRFITNIFPLYCLILNEFSPLNDPSTEHIIPFIEDRTLTGSDALYIFIKPHFHLSMIGVEVG